MTPEDLNSVLAALKKHGVTRFKGLDLELELSPPGADPHSLARAMLDLEAKDTCLCGHSNTLHNAQGECLNGCDLEKCYPGKETPREVEASA